MCTVLLPPGVYSIAVTYIISYHTLSYQWKSYKMEGDEWRQEAKV